jgi:predicted neutral ceramidase superfamily lipid hydrolase
MREYHKTEDKPVTARITRKFSSLAFLMRKAYRKILITKPSPLFIAFIAIALSIFLLGGGVYDILEKPLALLPGLTGRYIFFVPYALHEQTLNQSLIAILLYALGVLGFLLIYQSTKYAFKPRQASTFLLIGAVLTVLAYFCCEYIIWLIFNVPLS